VYAIEKKFINIFFFFWWAWIRLFVTVIGCFVIPGYPEFFCNSLSQEGVQTITVNKSNNEGGGSKEC